MQHKNIFITNLTDNMLIYLLNEIHQIVYFISHLLKYEKNKKKIKKKFHKAGLILNLITEIIIILHKN